MKNKVEIPFCLQLDSRNVSIIEHEFGTEFSAIQLKRDGALVPFEPVKTELILDNYLDLNRILTIIGETNKVDFTTAIIMEVGCGIGNGAETLARLFKADDNFPHLDKVQLIGIEENTSMSCLAEELFAKVTENYEVHNLSLNGRQDISRYLKIPDLNEDEIGVVFCRRIFKNLGMQQAFQEILLKSAPKNCFFIFPDGMSVYYKGVQPSGKNIFQKMSEQVIRIKHK